MAGPQVHSNAYVVTPTGAVKRYSSYLLVFTCTYIALGSQINSRKGCQADRQSSHAKYNNCCQADRHMVTVNRGSIATHYFSVDDNTQLGAHAQRGLQYLVCVSVCLLSVCLSTTILALQATRRLMSDTNSFSATRA